MRGVGEIEALQSLFGPLVPAFALVTQLGDLWLYFGVLSLCYWLGRHTPVVGDGLDRERAALVIALALGSLAVTTLLKELLAFPRPPGADTAVMAETVPAAVRPAYEWAATADGYGLPSGHALGTTVIWGGLAWAIEGGNRTRRLGLAAAVVVLVSLSRLVLGVHYGVDVVVGVVVGLAFLAAVLRWADSPGRAFGIAAAVALVGALLNGPTPDGVRVLGVTLGAVLTWQVAGDAVTDTVTGSREAGLSALVGIPVVGVPFLALEATEVSIPVAFLASAAILAALLALPLLVEQGAKEIGG